MRKFLFCNTEHEEYEVYEQADLPSVDEAVKHAAYLADQIQLNIEIYQLVSAEESDGAKLPTRGERITKYEPFDGDFDPNRTDELIQFIDDLLGNFGIHRELCLSMEDDSTVRVLASNNEGSEWIWDKCYPIPGNWTVEQVADLFQYGNIYFEPDVKNKRLEVVKEAVDELLDDDFLSSEVALEALEELEEVLREKIDELYAYIYAAERDK